MSLRLSSPPILLLILILLLAGCDNDKDDKLYKLSQESLARQAQQNQALIQQSQELASASKALIEADAKSRADWIGLEGQLQSERSSIDRQHESLEQERRDIARDRVREPLIANALLSLAGIIAAGLPLVLAAYLARGLLFVGDDPQAVELLLTELALPTCLPLLEQAGSRQPCLPGPDRNLPAPRPPLLIYVEGRHDIEFLKGISDLLNAADPSLPDLTVAEDQGLVTFIPTGGDARQNWSPKLPTPQFHLYDREVPPITAEREALVRRINKLPGCVAHLTYKRALENYLHPGAIAEVSGLQMQIDDEGDVADQFARQLSAHTNRSWLWLSRRTRRRLRDQAKHRLNTEVVAQMTWHRLGERDPDGEVVGWLRDIARLMETQPVVRTP